MSRMGFDRQSAERIGRVVKEAERAARDLTRDPPVIRGAVGGARLFYSPVGGIPARSGSTPGSATCDVVTWNGTALDNTGNGTVTVKNAYGSAFSAGKYVWAVMWEGTWWATSQEC